MADLDYTLPPTNPENIDFDETVLLNLRGSRPDTPPVRTRRASSGPGCLHTMTDEERTKLIQLWVMLDEYFKFPYSKLPPEAVKEMGMNILKGDLAPECDGPYEHPLHLELFRTTASDDPDTSLLRFLRARKWDLQVAFASVVECLTWRHEYGVHQLLCDGERRIKPSLLESGKGYIWGEDREGRLVCFMRIRLHDKNAQTLQQTVEHVIYSLEIARFLRRHDEQLITAVVDLEGAGLSSFDLPMVQFMSSCLQTYYPEVMGTCLVMNAPWMFWGFWSMLKNLLDPVVVSKIAFIKPAELCDYIDPAMIPIDFGGKSPFRYHYFPDPCSVKSVKSEESALKPLHRLERTFIELTRQIHQQWSPSIARSRNLIKAELRVGYYLLLKPVYPHNIYHRWEVIKENGEVDWARYRGPAERCLHVGELEQGRSSAPPK